METRPIYTITMLQFALHGRRRCVGFYHNLEFAISEVECNSMDIHECDHWYCVIEEVTEGLYCYPRKEIWFKWRKDRPGGEGYMKIEKPEHLKQVIGFGIG